jgi:hypothetical protein
LHVRNTKAHLCSWVASILHFFVVEKKDDTNCNTDDDDYDDTDQFTDIVCGYKTAKDMYQSQNPFYFQATVERLANRIANGGNFTLDGKRYVTFLQRCFDSLIKGGWIVLKENTCDDQAFVVGTEDTSISRSLPYSLLVGSHCQERFVCPSSPMARQLPGEYLPSSNACLAVC